LHREGIDVSDSPPFEMSGGGVMDGVGVAPEIKGVSVNTPITRPTQSFAARWRKNEP